MWRIVLDGIQTNFVFARAKDCILREIKWKSEWRKIATNHRKTLKWRRLQFVEFFGKFKVFGKHLISFTRYYMKIGHGKYFHVRIRNANIAWNSVDPKVFFAKFRQKYRDCKTQLERFHACLPLHGLWPCQEFKEGGDGGLDIMLAVTHIDIRPSTKTWTRRDTPRVYFTIIIVIIIIIIIIFATSNRYDSLGIYFSMQWFSTGFPQYANNNYLLFDTVSLHRDVLNNIFAFCRQFIYEALRNFQQFTNKQCKKYVEISLMQDKRGWISWNLITCISLSSFSPPLVNIPKFAPSTSTDFVPTYTFWAKKQKYFMRKW